MIRVVFAVNKLLQGDMMPTCCMFYVLNVSFLRKKRKRQNGCYSATNKNRLDAIRYFVSIISLFEMKSHGTAR